MMDYVTHWLLTAAAGFLLLLFALLSVFLEKRDSRRHSNERSSHN
jgi:hypothetical protein